MRPPRLGVALLLALTVSGCMGGAMGPMGPGMHGGGRGNDVQAPSPLPGAPELVVVAGDFSFEPNEIRIRVGETVNLTIENHGQLYHDLTIADLGFTIVAEAGGRGSGALLASQSGRFQFVCSVPGHAAAGMTGTLVVE